MVIYLYIGRREIFFIKKIFAFFFLKILKKQNMYTQFITQIGNKIFSHPKEFLFKSYKLRAKNFHFFINSLTIQWKDATNKF